MILPTANGGIAQQTADSHDAEKNIFSGESHGDDNGRDGERRAGDGPVTSPSRGEATASGARVSSLIAILALEVALDRRCSQ